MESNLGQTTTIVDGPRLYEVTTLAEGVGDFLVSGGQ